MCIGIPMQVLEVDTGRARCADGVFDQWVDTRLVDPVNVGSWLLVFADAAREIISPQRAALIADALEALRASAAGDIERIDQLFADLVDREPQLPEHLRPQASSRKEQEN